MDPSFWQGIIDADFAVPAGSSVAALTPHLVSYLSSTDPQLRDSFGFSILAVWIDRGGYFTPDQLREIGPKMLTNLSVGLGETDTDTVFGRSFAALILGKVIDADHRQPFLSRDKVHDWLDRALAYVRAERDVRGFVLLKGWAHAVAHMGDLLMYLARNRHVGAAQLERIGEAIGERLAQSANAYHNTRLFLRSLYFQLLLGIQAPFWYRNPTPFEHVPSVRERLPDQLVRGLRGMDLGFYACAP